MSSYGTESQDIVSTLYVTTIDVSVAMGSRKTIQSIKLRKNNQSLRDIQKTICAGDIHREEFCPPLALDPVECISLLVNCSFSRKRVNIPIDIDLRDIESMRDEQGIRAYRKKDKRCRSCGDWLSIVTCDHDFDHPVLFTSGVGKSSLIHKVFGVDNVHTSETIRGTADIDREFTSPTNERFVVHDSLGFEAADERNLDIVKEFVARRKAMPQLKDQLHAIWLCLGIPYCGGRLIEAGVEKFLQRRDEILGEIPLVVVLTKVDLLSTQLELDLPENETLGHYQSKYLNEHCIEPLRKAAGNDDGYSESLSSLVEVTNENMVKYHVDEAPRVVASIAQRVSIKEKIELLIVVGKKKYWKMLLKSAVFRGHTLKDCLQVIHKDIITAWNFNDPVKCLMNDNVLAAWLRIDNLGDTLDAPSSIASFASLLASSLELLKSFSGSGSGDIMSIAVPIARIVISLAQMTYETYQEAKKDVKILMAYIVDLIRVMQTIFLLTSSSRNCVTPQTVAFALQAYEKPRRFVHLSVDGFDGKLGALPGGRDHVLEKIEGLIWRHSITDHEAEELRQKIGKVMLSSA